MSDNIIKFPSKALVAVTNAGQPILASGPMVCMGCDHEEEVARYDVGRLPCKCPQCKLFKLIPQGLFEPPEDTLVHICDCGNDRYLWLADGWAFCENCGSYHDLGAS